MKTSTKEYLGDGRGREVDSEFDNCFLKFCPSNTFFGANLVSKLPSALFEMKLSKEAHSKVLIPNLTIVFVNSVPRMLFLGGEEGEGEQI